MARAVTMVIRRLLTKNLDLFDEETIGACNRKEEKYWGSIWHTKFDHPDYLMPRFSKRLQKQLDQNVNVLSKFVLTADKWTKK